VWKYISNLESILASSVYSATFYNPPTRIDQLSEMSDCDDVITYTEESCCSQIIATLTTLFSDCDCPTPHTRPPIDQPLIDIIELVVQKKDAIPTFIGSYEHYFVMIAEGRLSKSEVFPEEFDIEHQATLYAVLMLIDVGVSEAITTFVALRECKPSLCTHCLYRSLLLLEGEVWGHASRGVCTQSSTSSDSDMDVV